MSECVCVYSLGWMDGALVCVDWILDEPSHAPLLYAEEEEEEEEVEWWWWPSLREFEWRTHPPSVQASNHPLSD